MHLIFNSSIKKFHSRINLESEEYNDVAYK